MRNTSVSYRHNSSLIRHLHSWEHTGLNNRDNTFKQCNVVSFPQCDTGSTLSCQEWVTKPWQISQSANVTHITARRAAWNCLRHHPCRKATLGVLVQGTGWRAHAAVAALPHGQSLHLAEAALLAHAFLMHALHWLWRQAHTRISRGDAICSAWS